MSYEGKFEDNFKKVGSIWMNVDEDTGKTKYSGSIEGIGKVLMFKNSKTKDKQPDFNIYTRKENNDPGAYVPAPENTGNSNMDDLPF
jgi:hypothetical protein